MVDEVIIGDRQSESDHQLQSEHSGSGVHLGKPWRDASQGGSFAYRLGVQTEQPVVLCVTYWGSDSGNRVFDILLDGHKLATQRLDAPQPGKFFEVQYAVPAALLQGKQQVTVTFQAHPGSMAGGIFALAMLRQKTESP